VSERGAVGGAVGEALRLWREAEPILDAALDMEPEEWPGFLDRSCGERADLRRELESLLSRWSQLDGFLEALPLVTTEEGGCCPAGDGLEGVRTGAYRIVRSIGAGGMGDVYLGERADGLFQRQVALKFLRPFLAPEAARRFDVERRVLARLEHPSVARLIDAGVASDGRPYLVTEYVDGTPIHSYCFDHRLSLEARISLFRQVVDAVEHAHRNLLVHRDLKPSNILVTREGRVKLLDFGIAKLLERTDHSHSPTDPPAPRGPQWLTPEFAAPEQFEGDVVTTVTDVYQLGVLLYQLLSGRLPFTEGNDGRQGLEKAVLVAPPPPPSTVRHPDGAAGLRGALGADLDAVILKALRKDPGDRYPSAGALMADLDRALASVPVSARDRTRRYRLARLFRRRRLEFLAAALVVLSLVGGVGVAAWQARTATGERDEARDARLRAELALTQANQVTELLTGLFTDADPWAGRLQDPAALRSLLALGLARVESLGEQPTVQAGLMEALAQVHLSLGQASEAEALVEEALELRRETAGPDDPALAGGLNLLGVILKRQERYGEAQARHEGALDLQMRLLGEAHPEVARTLHLLAGYRESENLAESEALHRRALGIRTASLGAAHPLTLSSLRTLGRLARVQGEPARAEAYFNEALAGLLETVGPDHPDVALAKLNLADLLVGYRDDAPRAESLYRAAVAIQRNAFGDLYPGLTHGLEGLARIASARGDHATAEALLREGLELRRTVFGAEHTAVAVGLGFLAREFLRQGRLDEAEVLRREEVRLWEATVGPSHANVGGALGHLARIRTAQGHLDEAEALYLRAIEVRSAARGARQGAVAVLHGDLGRFYHDQGAYSRAEIQYLTALEILLEQRTDLHPDVRRLRQDLAELYTAWGRDGEGRPLRVTVGSF